MSSITKEWQPGEPLVQLLPYSVDPFWRDDLRTMAWVWARQKRKSSTAAARAFRRSMENPGLTSVFGSASIVLGGELLRKEAQLWQLVLRRAPLLAAAQQKGFTSNGLDIDLDGLCDLVEHSKLELKLWHDNTTCSRTVVVSPNPDTAVGWTGDIYLDEFGRIPDFQAVLEAVKPFIAANPLYRLLMMSTPPPKDDHYSYQLLLPPQEEFPVSPTGNWYISAGGIRTHRVDAYDAYAAGVPVFDDNTGEPLSPEEHRKREFDRHAWDRNHGCKFLRGGAAALNLFLLEHAMRRGDAEGCQATHVSDQIALPE